MNLPEREQWRLGARNKKERKKKERERDEFEKGEREEEKGRRAARLYIYIYIQNDRKCEERKRATAWSLILFFGSQGVSPRPLLVEFKKFLKRHFFLCVWHDVNFFFFFTFLSLSLFHPWLRV